MNAAPAAVPASCPDCGGGWIWRAAWWKFPAADPAWGYLVHCAEGHFHWFEAELAAGELEQAKRRFAPGASEEGSAGVIDEARSRGDGRRDGG